MNPNIQFNFRDRVEPVYRELVSLLLLQDNVSQETLQRAREVIEALQLAEIENFLKDNCPIEKRLEPVDLEEIDPTTAVIYPIILSDRLEIIISIKGELQHYTVNLPQAKIETALRQFFNSFAFFIPLEDYQKNARKIYNWLIEPIENQLVDNEIRTLVFVPDGFWRNIPLGALYDGQQYLLEKYAIATSPGLQLLPNQLPKIQVDRVQGLMAGVSKARLGAAALPGVKQELNQLSKTIANSRVLLDEQFTKSAFSKEIDTSTLDLIHMATHAQFSSIPNETFLLAWDGNISINELGNILKRIQLKKPIELLVLSACETASGDNRSVLGLAGLALKSTASTIGTLWLVNDLSTAQLMIDFYEQIAKHPERSKAEALRQAQLNLLHGKEYSPPYFWAPFVLVGNWL